MSDSRGDNGAISFTPPRLSRRINRSDDPKIGTTVLTNIMLKWKTHTNINYCSDFHPTILMGKLITNDLGGTTLGHMPIQVYIGTFKATDTSNFQRD